MLKKLFLTGIFVVSTSVPVLSYGDYITNSSSCDYATLNTYTSANLSAVFEPNNYTITYSCGSAPQGSASTPSGPTTTSSSTFTMDTTYTLAAAYNCYLPGYTFAGWSCPYLPGTPTLPAGNPQYFAGGATGTYSYAGNITCTAQWTPNKILLEWEAGNDASFTPPAPNSPSYSCEYDGGITLPTPQPSRSGYTFGGWCVQHSMSDMDITINSIALSSDYVRWKSVDGHLGQSDLRNGEWSVTFSYGTVKGVSACTSSNFGYSLNTNATEQLGITPGDHGNGKRHCWCKTTTYTPNNGTACSIDSDWSAWVYIDDNARGGATNCTAVCTYECAINLSQSQSHRQHMYWPR